jgi:4-carboxymuconolactone decarboxylase
MFAMATAIASAQALSRTQQPLSPIAAATAIGDIPQLNGALNHGFDAGPLFRVEK